jgi:hypothetical protein
MSDPGDREIDRAELDAYEVPAMPTGVEDRLWQRMHAAKPPRSRRWRLGLGGSRGAAASLAWFVTAGSPAAPFGAATPSGPPCRSARRRSSPTEITT